MREMLTGYLGDVGGLIAQFLITLAVVLILVLIVYALVRRFSGGRLGGIGRGRVPRLALVDAIAVDGRRRLVLVRRDNVEHLVLIGGPTDVVVEPSIQRPRQRARPPQQPSAPQATAPPQQPAFPPAVAPEATPPVQTDAPATAGTGTSPVEEARPAPPTDEGAADQALFRPPRSPVAEAGPPASGPPAVEPATAGMADVQRPTHIEPWASSESGEGEPVDAERQAGVPPPAPPGPADHPGPRADIGNDAGDDPYHAMDFGDDAAPATAANGLADENGAPARTEGDDAADDARAAARVSDLERDMARLLGEITSKRES